MTTTNTLDMVNSDHKKILDFIRTEFTAYSANVLEPALTDNLFKHAFMMTQYDKNGCISDTDLYFYLASETEDLSIDAYNEWTLENHDPDSYIYSMSEFNEVMSAFEPERIADMCYFGDYKPSAEYFTFDGYGNIKCISIYDDMPFDQEELKEYYIENNNLYYFSDTDREMIETALEYKNLIIDTALYMVSLGY